MLRSLKISRKYKVLPLIFFLVIPFGIFGDKATVKVKISWTYENPPGQMEIYEYKPASNAQLWETGEKKNQNELPVTQKISNSQFISAPGENHRFVLVMKNDSLEKKFFFAAPHTVEPGGYSLGFKFKCLCVNMVFEVSPGMYWYRVVELRISSTVKPGLIVFNHQISGLTEAEAKEYMKSFYEQMREENRMPHM
jgi:hypothetical protein